MGVHYAPNANCSCKDCTKRTVGCHASCPDYIQYRERLETIKKKKRKEDEFCAYKKCSYLSTLMMRFKDQKMKGF